MYNSAFKANAIVFDDQKLFAGSFSFFLESLGIFKSVQWFSRESELSRFVVKQANYDRNILFVDYYLSETNGLTIVNGLRRLNRSVKVIMMISAVSPLIINDIVGLKPDGLVSKSSGLDQVLEAIRAVQQQQTFISPQIQEIIDSNGSASFRFTDRQWELLQYFAKGYSIDATAKALFLSPHTVISHRKKMMKSFNCNSILELLAKSRQAGLI